MDDIELMDDAPLYDPDPDRLEVECPACEGAGYGIAWEGLCDCYACGGTGTVERSPDR